MNAKPEILYICWFRRNLRLHDNLLLTQASQFATLMLPLYIIDPCKVTPKLMSFNRISFLLECLQDLNNQFNNKYCQRLFITSGTPLNILKNIVSHIRGYMNFKGKIVIGLEKDYQPYERVRDSTVIQWARSSGLSLQFATTQTLWNLDLLEKKNGFKSCKSMKEFRSLIQKIGEPSLDENAPEKLPPPPKELFQGKIIGNDICCYFGQVQFFEQTPSVDQLELGFVNKDLSKSFKGGESVSLKRLELFIRNIQNLSRFSKNSQNPFTRNPNISTQSPYLASGCLSVRKFYHSLVATKRFFKNPEYYLKDQKNSASKKHKELKGIIDSIIWREYFYMTGCLTKNFDQLYDNPVSKLTDCWDYNPRYIQAWCDGRTGYPVIDAMINQLKIDGWIHKFSRQVLGIFLTKGALWQTWEVGLNYFQKYLIDFDWSINTACWIWISNTNQANKNLNVKLIRSIGQSSI